MRSPKRADGATHFELFAAINRGQAQAVVLTVFGVEDLAVFPHVFALGFFGAPNDLQAQDGFVLAVIGAFVVAADIARIDPATGTVVGGVMAVPVLGPLLVGTFVRSPVVNDWRVGLLVDAGVQLVGLSLLILGCVLDAGGAGTEIRLSETASVRFGEAGLVQFRF